MRQQQFIRFVQQICYLLKLSQPCSKTALQYFLQFKQYDGHHYDQQILIAACIYLSVKIFQEEVRIRDILNMIYVLTALYKLSKGREQEESREKRRQKAGGQDKQKRKMQIQAEEKQEVQYNKSIQIQQKQINSNKIVEQSNIQADKGLANSQIPLSNQQQPQQQPYILLNNLRHYPNLHQLIQPKYSLSDYNQYKGKIIQAQQMLLRILGFKFDLAAQNKKQLKRLLILIHHLRIPTTLAQVVIKTYNDMHYLEKLKYWPQGVIYFGYLVVKIMIEAKDSQIEEIQKALQQKRQKAVEIVQEDLELKESGSASTHQKKHHQREQAQIKRLKQFILSYQDSKKWQQLFQTDIKSLEKYAQRLTLFYSQIKLQGN